MLTFSLTQVQVALIKEYICRKYPCYEVQFVSVNLFLKHLCQVS